ncbi:MAG: hypothetical protein ABSH32_36100 [Bryobacteraceae bacterium]|jgi:hypothetical protein
MQELDDFKKFLGPIANDYTDAQLLQLRAEMRVMADLLLDIYLYRMNADNAAGDVPSGFDNAADSILEFKQGSAEANLPQKQNTYDP